MKKEMTTHRREFLKYLAGFTAGIMIPYPSYSRGITRDSIGQVLPKRILGKTGEEVTMLGLGGYHIGWTTEKDAQETIEAAIEGGIRFFDNAESYGPHTSEIRYGKYLVPKYRDQVFIMTKTQAKDAKTTREHLEGSLKRMKTDYLDLWQIHSVFSPEDVDSRLAEGVLDVVREAKASGKVRHIGFTGHRNPYAHARMLEKTAGDDPFDTCQLPVNIVDAAYKASFVKDVMPTLLDRNIGVLAMKTLADGRFFPKKVMNGEVKWTTDKPVVPERVSLREALNFAWSMPISVLITGAENADLIREKVQLARDFTKMSEKQRQKLVTKVEDLSSIGEVEYYKQV